MSRPSSSRAREGATASVGLGRLRGPATTLALASAGLGAVGVALGTVVAGRLAEDPSPGLLGLLAACVVSAAALDVLGLVLWASVVDRAEGRLRGDLLAAALAQPLGVLGEQAVGEVLDRVDDDTHEVGTTLRRTAWSAIRSVLTLVPLWVVGGLTWWPAFVVVPVAVVLTVASVRGRLAQIVALKVEEERAWSDHAAVVEEGVAARDDLRTSGGQAYVVRRSVELAATVHARFAAVVGVEAVISRRTGLLLHGALAATAVLGAVAASRGGLSTAALVTVFLVMTRLVGQVDQTVRHLPDLQSGFGAVLRLRQLMAVAPEPAQGEPLPPGDLDVVLHRLHFTYPDGDFALEGVDLVVPAGTTCALVGRSGSGKSTLVSLLSRAVEPEPGSVLLGGVDVGTLRLQDLRSAVGVVTQRTELLAGTLAENVTLFADVPRSRVEEAVAVLGLGAWVAALPEGLDTLLGPGGTVLSSGEEQLVAFARLLVRDVRVVVLDEATARMDPVTEARVVRAASRLLEGRTGLLVAHRLSTTERADQVVVLERGRVVQQGSRAVLAETPGAFAELLASAGPGNSADAAPAPDATSSTLGTPRVQSDPPPAPRLRAVPSLRRACVAALALRPGWGLLAAVLFLLASATGAFGAVTAWAWGYVVDGLAAGDVPGLWLSTVVGSLAVGPLVLAEAIRRYPRWWIEVLLRVRTSVLVGQTRARRLRRTPPGQVVGRALDADRFVVYVDVWVDLVNGLVVVGLTAVLAGSLLAGSVLLAVMAATALASVLGRPVAGRSAAAASASRADFGQALVSAVESARTVKLAAATPDVRAHLRRVDAGRVRAAEREHRVQALLDGVPTVMVQLGVVAAWGGLVAGSWGLPTALLVAGAVTGFSYFGQVAGSAITMAPGVRAWLQATSELAGGGPLTDVPDGVDLVTGAAPLPQITGPAPTDRLEHLELVSLSAVHDDGTVGVQQVDLRLARGELVLLLGPVGSGKSSLLAAVAGLVSHRGTLAWNGHPVQDPETFLRPGRVAHVAQVPRVLSGTLADNVRLDHDRDVARSVEAARLARDVEAAGGVDTVVGHRGVRLSGGQVQRLALARAVAVEAELLLADDVSSALDAATELEVWDALRKRGTTVLGATSKRAALARADRVVVLEAGRVVAQGPWTDLAPRWGHLAG